MMFRSILIVMVILLGWHQNLYARPDFSVVQPQQPSTESTSSNIPISSSSSSTKTNNPISEEDVELLNNALYFILIASAVFGLGMRYWYHIRQKSNETIKGFWAALAIALFLLWTPIIISNLVSNDIIYGYYGSHCFQEITDDDGNILKGIPWSAECTNERERTSALFITNALSVYKSQLGFLQYDKQFGLVGIIFWYSVILCFWVGILYYLLVPVVSKAIRTVKRKKLINS